MKLISIVAISVLVAGSALADPPVKFDWKQKALDQQKFIESMQPAKNAMEAQTKANSYKKDKEEWDNTYGQAAKAANDLKNQVNQGVGLGKSAKEALDAFKALTKEDETASPDYSPPGMPHIPSKCAESGSCGACYEDAYADLKKARINLERLRAVGAATKNLYEKGVAFGDNVSGVHGMVGMAWQAEKLKVSEAMSGFNKNYDAKHIELIAKLEASLQKISKCEAEHFNEDGWYERFGFIYYTFMSDRYKRWW
jgi:hypothetical protein